MTINKEKELLAQFIFTIFADNRVSIDNDIIDKLADGLIARGYGRIDKFAETVKQALENYRLDNEYFTENEPNSNLWQMNSSIFYLEVIENGGLIDKLLEEYKNDSN